MTTTNTQNKLPRRAVIEPGNLSNTESRGWVVALELGPRAVKFLRGKEMLTVTQGRDAGFQCGLDASTWPCRTSPHLESITTVSERILTGPYFSRFCLFVCLLVCLSMGLFVCLLV